MRKTLIGKLQRISFKERQAIRKFYEDDQETRAISTQKIRNLLRNLIKNEEQAK
jgi:hypothetical protein